MKLSDLASALSLYTLGAIGVGCGTRSTDCNLTTIPCSCDRRTLSSPDCRDYEGVSVASATSKCSTASGTFSSTALCTTTSRAGTCREVFGTTVNNYRYYIANYSTAASGAGACEYVNANCLVVSLGAACSAAWTSDI